MSEWQFPWPKEDLAPLPPCPPPPLFPDEHEDILIDVADVFGNPDVWLDLPNPHMGFHTPRSLIGTDREGWVRGNIRAIIHGLYS